MSHLWFVVPAMAFINAFRGGHFGADRVPGHPRLWATAAVFGLALLALPPWPAAAFAAGFLAWCLPPWGHLIGLGRHTPGRRESFFEDVLLDASRGNVHLALWMRHLPVLPMVLAVSPEPRALVVAALLATLIMLAYETGWRLTPAAPIRTAEIIVGAFLGALLLGGCRADTNAFYAKGGSTGPIHCKGACP